MKNHAKKGKKMNPHNTFQHPIEAHTNIFSKLTEHANQIEQR